MLCLETVAQQFCVAAGADDLIQLLLMARKHAVEPAVLACLQRLQQKVDLRIIWGLLHHLSWLCKKTGCLPAL
jgi:hypothetical protein